MLFRSLLPEGPRTLRECLEGPGTFETGMPNWSLGCVGLGKASGGGGVRNLWRLVATGGDFSGLVVGVEALQETGRQEVRAVRW